MRIFRLLAAACVLAATLTAPVDARKTHHRAHARVHHASPAVEQPARLASVMDAPVVQTEGGQVAGWQAQPADGTDHYTSIPYAAPPTGNLRWRKPQKAASWGGVRPANPSFQPSCPGGSSGNEDCLYLNVFAPSNRTYNSPVLPVYVFIHGGGWNAGTGLTVPGQFMALKENLIFVGINYRLGPFGFWASPALAKENDDGASGNWGLLDQVRALQWVHDNIANFGGDPNRVRIGGESAGAFSVCALMASPKAQGLFHGGIIESGTCNSGTWFAPLTENYAWGQTAAQSIGCGQSDPGQQLNCMRGGHMTTEHVLAAFAKGPTVHEVARSNSTTRCPHEALASQGALQFFPLQYPVWPWSATIDGAFLTATPMRMMQQGNFNKVPLIAGNNRDEMVMLAPLIQQCVPGTSWPLSFDDVGRVIDHFFNGNSSSKSLILNQYPASRYSSGLDQFLPMFRDLFFLCDVQRSLAILEEQGVRAWSYSYQYTGMDGHGVPTHSMELPFVWGLPFGAGSRDAQMSDSAVHLWGQFTSGGDPQGPPGSLTWPSFTDSQRNSLVLDVPLSIAASPGSENCAMWNSIAG